MVLTMAFAALAFVAVLALAAALVLGVWRLIALGRKKTNPRQPPRLRRALLLSAASMLLSLALAVFSQWTAHTPAIRDENGNVLPNSVAELIALRFHGRKQWISIRGVDQSKPVLLFLAGGPGGTQLAAVRHELGELEKHFVVVGWDQPGSGKSYNAGTIPAITVETYLEDGYALTRYLQERFGQEKIFLVGESWGSALGIFLVHRYPEAYRAFIGTGPMVDFLETEKTDYTVALEMAKNRGEEALVRILEGNGPPPYYGKGVTWKIAAYLNFLSNIMAANPAIHNPGYNTFRDLFSPEYGVLDQINFFSGLVRTFEIVYPQLYQVDLRRDCPRLKVPVAFFAGRHDLNAPPFLVEEYLEVLDAPVKELVWFEHSGHSPWINERERFVQELLDRFGPRETEEESGR